MELFYLLSLSQIPGIGPISGKTLISHCGSAEAVFKEKKRVLEKIPGIGSIGAAAIRHESGVFAAEKEIKFIEQTGIRVLPYTSPEYPIRLKQILDSPLLLFVRGNIELNPMRTCGIVGTRKNTAEGAQTARNIVSGLNSTTATSSADWLSVLTSLHTKQLWMSKYLRLQWLHMGWILYIH